MIGSLKSIRTCIAAHIAVYAPSLEICSCTKHNCAAVVYSSGIGLYTCNIPAIVRENIRYLRLTDGKVLRILNSSSHLPAVLRLVSLRTQGVNCRSLGAVKHLRLDECFVNIFAHLSAQCIKLSHKMSLGASANIGITRHHCNALNAHREHDRLKPQPGTGKCCLASCMSGAYNYNIIIFLKIIFHFLSPCILQAPLAVLPPISSLKMFFSNFHPCGNAQPLFSIIFLIFPYRTCQKSHSQGLPQPTHR